MATKSEDCLITAGSFKTDESDLSCFEDFMTIVGPNGKRNILIFIFCSLGAMCSPLVSYTYGYLGATPDYWCDVEALHNSSFTIQQRKIISIPRIIKNDEETFSKCTMYRFNYSNILDLSFEEAVEAVKEASPPIVSCKKRVFNGSLETVTTKWDLVCENRVAYTNIQGAILGGFMLSSVVTGYLLDRVGRRPIFVASILIHIIVGLAGSFTPSVELFTIVKFLQAVTTTGYYIAGFVIAVELTTCKQRSMVASYYAIPYSFGIMISALIAYFVRPWYYLQAALVLPNLILLPACWIVPESPRWLITMGKHDKAKKILESLAKSNGRMLPNNEKIETAMKKIEDEAKGEIKAPSSSVIDKVKNVLLDLISLLTNAELKYRTIAIFFCWFAAALIYYGVSLGSPVVNINEYLYTLISGAIEIPAYLILLPMAVYLGRKLTLIITYFTCGVTITAALVLFLTIKHSEFTGLKAVLFLIGKFGIVIAYQLLWIYTAELYPTKYRSIAVGQASTFASAGSIFSPYISDLLGQIDGWVPAAVFSIMSVLAGIVSFIFPETKDINLTDG